MEGLRNGWVLLMEGSRKVKKTDENNLFSFAKSLVENYSEMIFRSGNASGSDEFFAKGIESVNPQQMEQVLPYSNANKKRLHNNSRILVLDELTDNEIDELGELSIEATPSYKGLIKAYTKTRTKNRLTVKALYLLRDALKVTGLPRLGFRPANAGIFYLNLKSPGGGGTGHTIRICHLKNIPVFTQESWLKK